MLSISECRTILENGSGKKYSDKEVKLIRTLLYQLAEIDYANFKADSVDEQKSCHLYPRLN